MTKITSLEQLKDLVNKHQDNIVENTLKIVNNTVQFTVEEMCIFEIVITFDFDTQIITDTVDDCDTTYLLIVISNF